jgi:hypothetical protein
MVVLFIQVSCAITFSQDTVVCKNGTVISCRIQKEDSTSVFFSFYKNKVKIKTYLNKNEIASYKYDTPLWNYDRASLGLGVGLDYGGLGGNIVVYPLANLGIFGGVGYALAGTGYNTGIKLRLAGKNHRSAAFPYLIGMYGYNAAIVVSNAKEYNKFFYGPTYGFGIDLHKKIQALGFWSFALMVPARSSSVNEYIDHLKYYHKVSFKNKLYPVSFSIGYRLNMGTK